MWRLETYVAQHVDRTIATLVKIRSSVLNECTFCIDMHSRDAVADGETMQRVFAVAAWRDSPFFDERERAALALTDALTRLGDDGVPDRVWEDVRQWWSERETADLVLAVGVINLWNRILIATRRQLSPARS